MNSLYKSNLYKNYRGLLISFIDVCIVFLAYIVAFLIQNNFFPVVILPHFADGKDIIEYQYIDDALASMIPDCLINKNEIVSYLKNKQ